MTAESIAQKLWNLCNVLRDDGVTYHQYLNELTFILFLKLSEVKGFAEEIPAEYRWDKFVNETDNTKAFNLYRDFLANVSQKTPSASIKTIYTNASTSLRKPVNFSSLVKAIDKLDWYEETDRDMMGDIYESLLEKNATEKKSGAGQYFTPRPLINVMVKLSVPKLGERWNDPAAGTFGFMISADHYLKQKTDDYYKLNERDRDFQKREAFSGVELVPDAHRLALMNARLHGMESRIDMGDTLSSLGEGLKDFDGVLANPPFGTKKGGEHPSRKDFTITTSNKQLNFLHHIYRSLKRNGEARAAVILPDNVLFEDNDGRRIRQDLMNKCNLHTILRLPTGIFYAAGVKTNVLFFSRGKKEVGNTDKVWFYDMRTNMPAYGKRTPFTEEAFQDFIYAYTGGISADNVVEEFTGVIDHPKRAKIKDERWQCFTRKAIADKGDSLDLGLIADSSLQDSSTLGEPEEIIREAKEEITAILAQLDLMLKELK
ncbi:MAG: SAM-dependent methyltransferase [Bacteroidetes bacterium]|nr:SAM-dependent methyltransferase [Bacteroidota bacterium]MBP1616574.1 SAM-dependent methyltransferase [Bacteroidota bacterium]